jgi:hypothetical protein
MKLIVLMAFISLDVFASQIHTFKIEGKNYQFSRQGNVLINTSCNGNCMAIKRITHLKVIKPSKFGKKFSMSLGSYNCENSLHGSSVLGIDIQRNMRAFCYFDEDNSMIEINSLNELCLKK